MPGRRRYLRFRRAISWLGEPLGESLGQATLEYALVLLCCLAACAACAALWKAGTQGLLVAPQVRAASHGSGQGLVGQAQDLLLY